MIIRMAKVEIVGPKQDLLSTLDLLHNRGIFQPDPQLMERVVLTEDERLQALVLDENELQLDDPLGPTMESGVIATHDRSIRGSRRGRAVLWLLLLLAAVGGFGYLWYSGLLPVGPWLESLM
jgi:hypothetical protein